MVEGGAPHHFARLKAAENKTTAQPQADTEGETQDDEFKDLGRMADQYSEKRRQEWKTLDLSGQGLRVLTMPVFAYDFLRTLYLSSNKLKELPPAIGRLGNLYHLDLSFNQLTSLPMELSMCVNLEHLYLFDNRIQNLPVELGTLFKLEMLGIEGNPIDEEVKRMIMENGTKALIQHLRETAPSKTIPPQSLVSTAWFLTYFSPAASPSSRNTRPPRLESCGRSRDLQGFFLQHPHRYSLHNASIWFLSVWSSGMGISTRTDHPRDRITGC
jgi:hypothetical protein